MIPLTIRHVYDFGAEADKVGDDLAQAGAWDALRVQTDGPFALPDSRDAWEQAASAQPALASRAAAIDAWCTANGIARLASYGVGTGLLELSLYTRAPRLQLVCADYAPATVDRLAGLFAEAEVHRHDFLVDPPLEADAHLFHRVDTELPDRAWPAVFARFAGQRILLVAAEVIDLRRATWELRRRLTQRGATKAGWIRNAPALERLWRRTHEGTRLTIGDLQAWDLRPR